MTSTRIEWADEVWNPTLGCSQVSPGCMNCYAIRVAARGMTRAHQGLTKRTPEGLDWTGELRMLDERITQPLRWKKPRRIFVNSMSDLFHPSVPATFILDVWSTMEQASWHQFQILTKRPQRMVSFTRRLAWNPDVPGSHMEPYLTGDPGVGPIEDPLENVWLGTSIESDEYAWRASHLRRANAQVKFLSLEPLLGPLPSLDLTGIDWVIVGGESGPGARPMHPRWVREIRDRCVDVGVPFLFKQWGEWKPDYVDPETGHQTGVRVGKKAAGRELDGRLWDQYPEGHTPTASR